MKIVWSEGAYADYDEILDYLIRDFGLQSASDFQAKLDYNIGMLKEFPLVGYLEYTNPKTRIVYRSLSCKQYKIVYAIMSDRLIIVSLWNNRRNPKNLRRLLKTHGQ
jgi:plasmid stabilization system protein ParE